MKIAIVTGASSGIGREYVKQISQREKLDEIWVIARREERLIELKNTSVHITLHLAQLMQFALLLVLVKMVQNIVKLC